MKWVTVKSACTINLRIQTDFMEFCHVSDKQKTSVWHVVNLRSGLLLGVVEWYPPWRQYVFFPEADTVFSKDCLEEINRLLIELNSKKLVPNELREQQELMQQMEQIASGKAVPKDSVVFIDEAQDFIDRQRTT